MNIKLAKRMAGFRASEIHEILKLTQRSEVISFAGGLPAIDTFPASDIAAVTSEVLAENGALELQYSLTEGFPPLRMKFSSASPERIKEGVKRRARVLRAAINDRVIRFGARLHLCAAHDEFGG